MDKEKINICYGQVFIYPELSVKLESHKPKLMDLIISEITNLFSEFVIPALLFSLSVTCFSIAFR